MTVIYETTITRIGQSAPDALCDQMLITFREGAPADIEEFCFIHCHGDLNGSLQAGIQFELGQHHYPVTAVVEAVEPPELAAWFTGLRSRLGMEVLPLDAHAGTASARASRSTM